MRSHRFFTMKILVVLTACITLSAGSVFPVVPRDNSHYVEGVSRYIWMADGEGELHLVDLEAPIDDDPESRSGANNQYWLFTRQNRQNHQLLTNGNINTVRNSNYNANRPTFVVAHGWRSDGNSQINRMIRDELLNIQDCNVIVLDWRRVAGNINYISSSNGVINVGQHLGDFLVWLFNNAGGNWNQMHLIGFSLGAHVVGNAGRRAGGRPRRVTGLDPAGPRWGNNINALNRNSAQYVEAIHTDGGWYGIFDRIADADFYPNGGRNRQPGCASNSCSHSRAYHLYASSVRTPNRFQGRLCANIQQAQNNQCTGAILNMGNADINKRGSGIYGLRTANSWPF